MTDLELSFSPLFPGPSRDGEISLHGHCAAWCDAARELVLPRQSGNTVAEHYDETFCTGQVGTSVAAQDVDTLASYVGVELLSHYVHGRYQASDLRSTGVGLTLSSPNGLRDHGFALMDSSAARSLAAILIHAADRLEGLTSQDRSQATELTTGDEPTLLAPADATRVGGGGHDR